MEIKLTQLAEDRSLFCFSYGYDLEPLILSIVQSGILHPLLVRKQERKYLLVSGQKRYQAAKKLGLTEVPVQELKGDLLQAFQAVLLENRSIRDLNPVEKALAIRSLQRLKVADTEIISVYLPLLGLSPTKDNLDDHLSILVLEEAYLQQIAAGRLPLDAGVVLSKWQVAETAELLKLLVNYKVNFSKAKEVINYLDDIKLRDKLDIGQLIRALIGEVPKNKQMDQQFEAFRNLLRARRYPHIAQAEIKWAANVKELAFSDKIKVIPPKDLEGEGLTVQLNIKDKQALNEQVARLSASLAQDTWDEMFRSV